MEAGRTVHIRLGHRGPIEVAVFTNDTTVDELKDLFRSAAEAGPLDIVKLYSADGRLTNIWPGLKPNTPDKPYRLEVVAAHCNGMLLDEVGVDLKSLEERVARLERQIRADLEELPPSVKELKEQVDRFRAKLETTEHLSWLGFYKELPPPLSTEACRRLQYRRKSDSIRRRVRDKFYKICDVSVSEEVRNRLRQPTFDGCQWEDEEVLLLLQQMYVDLELPSKFAIDMAVLRRFLYEVYNNYNEVPFHNFRHSFCVAQMMYAMMWAVDLPGKLGDLETLVLLTSCICHDLDHPGYNNIYQINAKTELALRYNDISPLENHHCSVAFRILERPDCNILASLDGESYRRAREGIIRCILATDMARHNEILQQFKDATPNFDFSDRAHVNLLCMVLIKVADISNEARPMEVAEPWLDRLLQEFFKQSDAEKLEGLPVTPFMDRDKITKPSSQCSFIGFVLLPLFEALGELFTELQPLIVQPVRDALDYYRRLNDAAKDEQRAHRKSLVDEDGRSVVKSASGHSVRSARRAFGSLGGVSGPLLLHIKSRSRSTDEEQVPSPLDVSEEQQRLPDGVLEEEGEPQDEGILDEDQEEEEDEAVTEVEVSEKTLKFKIATSEGSGRRSYPGSRKGSREGDTGYRKRSMASPASSGGEMCNGGGGHSGRSSLDSRRQTIAPPDETEEFPAGTTAALVSSAPATPGCQHQSGGRTTPQGKPSLLARLRSFAFGSSGSDRSGGSSREGTPLRKASPTVELPSKGSTLPKARRPRGWKALIGGNSMSHPQAKRASPPPPRRGGGGWMVSRLRSTTSEPPLD